MNKSVNLQKKKISAYSKFLIGIAIIISIIIVPIFAIKLISQNTYAFNGDGSASNPFSISTKADLKLLSTVVNGGNSYSGTYFSLSADIDMEGEAFVAIGKKTAPFAGNFNGNGKKILNLWINASVTTDIAWQGLFGYLSNATIENIFLDNTNLIFNFATPPGGAAGATNAAGKPGSSVCDFYTGGIAGYAENSSIKNCYVDGSVIAYGSSGSSGGAAGTRNTTGAGYAGGAGADGKDSYVGGIVGSSQNTVIENNGFSGFLNGSAGYGGTGGAGGAFYSSGVGGVGGNGGNGGTLYLGGIVGNFVNSDNGIGLLNKNYVNAEIYGRGSVGGNGGAGGKGSATGGKGGANGAGGDTFIGGIAGKTNANVTNCFSQGNIDVAAGIVGINGTGGAPTYPSGTKSTIYPTTSVGGIAGLINTANIEINSCYSNIDIDERHDYFYYNQVDIRLGGIVGMITADNVSLINNIALNKNFSAETYTTDGVTLRKKIANYATYNTLNNITSSLVGSANNKCLENFNFVADSNNDAVYAYKKGDSSSVSVSDGELQNNLNSVFENFDTSIWKMDSTINNGLPTFVDVTYKEFDYTKRVNINNYTDLLNFSKKVNRGYSYYGQNIYINNDIEMDTTNPWNPIGASVKTLFQGTIYGQGHTISKMLINKSTDYKGLFGYTTNFVIKDLTIEDPVINNAAGSYVGAFLGYNLYNCVMENLKVTQSPTTYGNSAIIKGNRIIGGIAGYLNGNYIKIHNVSNTVDVNATCTPYVATSAYVGGLFGFLKRADLSKSYNTGNVTITASTTALYYAGGLLGCSDGNQTKITNCFNMGNVTGGLRVAGLIGYFSQNSNGTVIDSCYSGGSVTSTYTNTVVTIYNGSLFALCYYNVTVKNTINMLDSLVVNTKHTTRFISRLVAFGGANRVLSANAYYTRDTFIGINNYFNSNGTMTAAAGSNTSYYLNLPAHVTSKTLVQLKDKTFLKDTAKWDFDNIWDIDPNVNKGYPFFKGKDGESGFEEKPGVGTKAILISNESELKEFRDNVNAGNKYTGLNIKLSGDINLNNENWAPIGNSTTNYFSGNFDGDGHTISGLYVDKATVYKGLFGYAVNATFKNINFTEPKIVLKAGGFVGALLGQGTTNIKISNVNVKGGYIRTTENGVGGIVGRINEGGNITDCSSEGVDIFGANHGGGIIGYAGGTTAKKGVIISDSYNTSHVRVSANYAAGIAGVMSGGTIDGCYNTGSMIAGAGYSGGITAYLFTAASEIKNCANLGNVYSHHSGSSAIAGGIVGYANIAGVVVSYCFSTGDIRALSMFTATGNVASSAGIIGYANTGSSTINYCVSANENVFSDGVNIKYNGASPMGAGLTTARPSGGGTAGSSNNMYYKGMVLSANKNVTNAQLTAVVSDGKTMEELKMLSSYQSAGWGANISTNNTTTWVIDGSNTGFPFLSKFGEYKWAKGSAVDPYLISTKQDLTDIAARVAAGDKCGGQYFEITNNIILGEWSTPIGTTWANSFAGILDGQRYTIKDLKTPANRTNGYYGLFGYCSMPTLKNIVLSNVSISVTGATTTGDRIGALAGQVWGTGIIENCAVTSGSITTPAFYVGGLIGIAGADNVIINKCYAAVNIKAGAYSGGLIGRLYGGKVTNSYATGSVSTNAAGNYGAGGLVGQTNATGTSTVAFENCYATGNVSDSSTSTYAIAGSLVGHNYAPATYINCYGYGDVTATTTWSSTTSGYGAYASGLIGVSNKATTTVVITNCASFSKKITATAAKAHTAQATKIVGCTNTTATNVASGTNCWTLDTAVYSVNKGVAGIATANAYAKPKAEAIMLSQVNLENTVANGGLAWDFTDTWAIKPSVNNGYPYLLGLIPNRSDLENIIAEAKTYVREDWRDDLFNDLQVKLTTAVTIYENSLATFEELDKAYIDTKTAIEALRGDTAALETLYNTFVTENEGCEHLYQNWGLVDSSLKTAKLILDEDSNAYSNSYINNAYAVLKGAIASLVIDKTELNKIIAEANDLKESNYEAGHWAVLVRIKLDAIAVNNNKDAKAREVLEAINSLRKAIDELVVDLTMLQQLIAEGYSYTEGILPSKFTLTSYDEFIKAIRAAEAVNENTTAGELNTAAFNLAVAINNLTLNTDLLLAKVNIAESKDMREYTTESAKALETALNAARNLLAQPRVEPSEFKAFVVLLDEAYLNLDTAINGLEVNTELLSDILIKAKAEVNDDQVYTTESWEVLQNAIAEAEAMLMPDAQHTGEQILAMTEKLKNSILNLEINKTFLVSLIADAEKIEKGNYNTASYDNLKNVISASILVRDDSKATILQVRGAMNAIKTATANLKIDDAIVRNYIARIEEPNHENYIVAGLYSTESYLALKLVEQDAINLLYTNYTNEQINDIIKRFEFAFKNLAPNKSDLNTYLAELKTWTNTKYRQDNEGNWILDDSGALKQFLVYSSSTWNALQTAINKADITLHSNIATLDEVLAEVENLNKAVAGLRVDVTELEYKVTHAESLLLETSKYTAESLAVLQAAKDEAVDALNADKLTLEQLQAVMDKLTSAIAKLVVDRSTIVDLINLANSLVEADYTAATWKNFIYTRNYVNSIISSPGLTADDVANLYASLDASMKQLRPNKTAIIELVIYANGLNAKFMTSASYTELQKQIVAAQAVIDNADALLTDVNTAIANLQTAIDNIVVDKTELLNIINLAKEKYLLGYTIESIDDLKLIVAEAQVIYDDSTADIDEVMSAADSILNGIDSLLVDKTSLQALLDSIVAEMETLINEIPASDYYTTASYEALMEATTEGNYILNNEVSLEEVLNVIERINLSKAGLIVEKTELSNLITEADKINTNLYMPDGATVFIQKLSTAKTVLANDAATINQYLTALNELTTAKDALVFDTTALDKLLEQASEIFAHAEDYTSSSVDALKDATDAANDVSPEDYPAICAAIETNIRNLVYIKTLKEKIATAEAFLNNNMADYETNTLKYYISHFLRLKAGYDIAVDDVTDAYLTKQQVDKLIIELSYESYMTYIGDLKEVLLIAEREDENLYSKTSYAKLKVAMENARGILNNDASTKAEIDTSVEELNTALNNLEAILFTNMLSDLYDEVKDYKAEDFTSSTYLTFVRFKTQAEAIIANSEASQAAAMEVYNLFKDSIDKLVYIGELNALIAEYEKIQAVGYTDASFAAFATALTNAKAISAKADATNDEVSAEIASLTAAKASLVVDVSKLTALYNRVKNYKASDFTTDSDFANFALRRTEAADAISNGNTTAILNAAINLNAAVLSLKVDTTELNAIIAFSKTMAEESYLSGYTEFVTKATELEALLNNEQYLSLEAYKQELSTIKTLRDNLVYDTSELAALIATATEILNATENYSANSIAALQPAYQAAENFNFLTDDYVKIVNNLSLKIDNIVYIKGLIDAYTAAKTFEDLNHDAYLNNKLDFIEKGYAQLINAIIEAKTLTEKANVTTAEINAMLLRLDYVNNLVYIKDLKDEIIKAGLIDESKYTAETFEALDSAVANANQVKVNEKTTNQDVADAIQLLTEAMQNLVVKTTKAEDLIKNFENLNGLHYESGYMELGQAINELRDLVDRIKNGENVSLADYEKLLQNAQTKQDNLVLISKDGLQQVIDQYLANRANYTVESFNYFNTNYLTPALALITDNVLMLQSEIDDAVALLALKAQDLVLKGSEDTGAIEVVDTNTTFEFLDKDGNVIDKAGHNYDENEPLYLGNIALDEKLSTVVSQFNNSSLKIFTAENQEITDITNLKVNTGMIIRLYDANNNVVDSITLVVKGDISGAGRLSTMDKALLNAHITGASILSGAYLLAADINGDGRFDTMDKALLNAQILGNVDLYEDIRLEK